MLNQKLMGAVSGAAPEDTYFKNVTLLLNGDGTNGAQNNTFLDSSTNNFTITRNGNTTQGTFSPYGNLWSNYFDGTVDYLTASANSALDVSTGDFTFESWVYPTTTTNSVDAVFGYGAFTTMLYHVGTTWYWEVGNGSSNYFTITGTAPLNTWSHIACTRNGNTFTLWINGVSAGTGSTSGAVATSSKALGIGLNNGTNGLSPPQQSFTGYISNFRLVKGTAIYTTTFTPPTTPLTAVSGTSLLTCQSNRFIDNSSNNFTITRNGDVRVTKFSPFNPTAPYSAAAIGGSGYFDGSGDYLSVADNTALDLDRTTDWTVEGWVYPQSSGNQVIVGSADSGGSSNWALQINSSNQFQGYWLNTSVSSYAVTSASTISLNAWYHIALVNSSGVMSLYVNGASVGTPVTLAGTYRNLSASTSIGRTGDYNGLYWNGSISNLRIVKGTAVYTGNFTPPTASLTAISGTSLLLNFTNAGIPDAAMQNNLETVGNAQVSTSVKKYNTGSMYFDGTGDWLFGNDPQTIALRTGDFTVEFWINPTNWSSTYAGVIASATTGALWIGKNAGNFVLRSANTADLIAYSTFPTTGTWTHVAITRSGTTARLFYNGTQVASGTTSNDFVPAPFYVGQDGGSNAFTGYIDDLRITKGYARYTANFTPPTAALPLY